MKLEFLAVINRGKNNDGYADNISLVLHESRTRGSQMVFEMRDGADLAVTAVIQGNKIRVQGEDIKHLAAKEINPTNGLGIIPKK